MSLLSSSDTEGFYSEASDLICQRYGKRFTYDVKLKQMGRKAEEAAQVFIEMTGIPMTWEEYLDERETILHQLFPRSKIMPGTSCVVCWSESHETTTTPTTHNDKLCRC